MANQRTIKRKSVGVRLEQVDQLEGTRLIRTTYVLHDDRSPGTDSFTSLAKAEDAYLKATEARS